MQTNDVIGSWLLERTGGARDATTKPSRWHRSTGDRERLDVASDGSWARRSHGRTRSGTWKIEGLALILASNDHAPWRVTLEDARIELRELDEEHGGFSVAQFARPLPVPSVDELVARVNKARDAKKLIEKEGLVEHALREGHLGLLELCLGKGAAVYPVSLSALHGAPHAQLPPIVRVLVATPSVARMLPQYLAEDASSAIVEAFLPVLDPATRAASVLALFAGTYVRPDRKDLLTALARGARLDVRDAQGIPLLVHAVTKAPAEWVSCVKAAIEDPNASLDAPRRLVLDTGAVDLAAGTTPTQAAAHVIASLDAQIVATPALAARLTVARDRIRLACSAL